MPLMMSAAFSAIINTQAVVFPPIKSGMTEASTTRNPERHEPLVRD